MNQNILIKSADRESGSSHDFVFKSHCLLDGNYIVKNVIIANTFYNINERNNTFLVNSSAISSPPATITITPGNYNVCSIITELTSKLDAITSPSTWTITYNQITSKLTFNHQNPFTFIFKDLNTAKTYGFSKLITELSIFSAPDWVLACDQVINLSAPNSIGIAIRECNDNVENAKTLSSCSIYLPLDASFGYYKNLDVNEFEQKLKFKHNRELNFKVIDTSNNSVVELNGSDFEILITKC